MLSSYWGYWVQGEPSHKTPDMAATQTQKHGKHFLLKMGHMEYLNIPNFMLI
jgi:hypothetical protein